MTVLRAGRFKLSYFHSWTVYFKLEQWFTDNCHLSWLQICHGGAEDSGKCKYLCQHKCWRALGLAIYDSLIFTTEFGTLISPGSNSTQSTKRGSVYESSHAVRKRDKAVRDLEQEQCSRHPFDERRRIERGSHQTATGVGGHRDMQAMETVCWKKDKRKAPNRGSVRVQPVYGWRLWSFLPVPCYTTSLHRHNPILCGRSLRANQVSHGVEVKGRECSGRPFSPSRSVPHSRLRPKRWHVVTKWSTLHGAGTSGSWTGVQAATRPPLIRGIAVTLAVLMNQSCAVHSHCRLSSLSHAALYWVSENRTIRVSSY